MLLYVRQAVADIQGRGGLIVKIPMDETYVRSLNLATSVGIGLYEVRTSLRAWWIQRQVPPIAFSLDVSSSCTQPLQGKRLALGITLLILHPDFGMWCLSLQSASGTNLYPLKWRPVRCVDTVETLQTGCAGVAAAGQAAGR